MSTAPRSTDSRERRRRALAPPDVTSTDDDTNDDATARRRRTHVTSCASEATSTATSDRRDQGVGHHPPHPLFLHGEALLLTVTALREKRRFRNS
jgi:hypothetical protein